jgi:hypothetical protein
MGLAQSRQQPAQSVPPRFPDNIADKEKIHRLELNPSSGGGKSAFVRTRLEDTGLRLPHNPNLNLYLSTSKEIKITIMI